MHLEMRTWSKSLLSAQTAWYTASRFPPGLTISIWLSASTMPANFCQVPARNLRLRGRSLAQRSSSQDGTCLGNKFLHKLHFCKDCQRMVTQTPLKIHTPQIQYITKVAYTVQKSVHATLLILKSAYKKIC